MSDISIIKWRLDKIVRNNKFLTDIRNSVDKINHIVTHTYMFIRLYILHQYELQGGKELPIINQYDANYKVRD